MPRIDMRKNIKVADRPRENAKEVEFVMRLNLTVKNDDGDAIEKIEKFLLPKENSNRSLVVIKNK